jgi:hypothetical protein
MIEREENPKHYDLEELIGEATELVKILSSILQRSE